MHPDRLLAAHPRIYYAIVDAERHLAEYRLLAAMVVPVLTLAGVALVFAVGAPGAVILGAGLAGAISGFALAVHLEQATHELERLQFTTDRDSTASQ